MPGQTQVFVALLSLFSVYLSTADDLAEAMMLEREADKHGCLEGPDPKIFNMCPDHHPFCHVSSGYCYKSEDDYDNTDECALRCKYSFTDRATLDNLVDKADGVKVRKMVQSDCGEGKLAPWKLFDVKWDSCSGCKRQEILEKVTPEGCNINWVVGNEDTDTPSEEYDEKKEFRCNPEQTPASMGPTDNKFKTILGFKQDINSHCNENHRSNGPAEWDTGDKEHGSDCVKAGYHRLRFNGDAKKLCDGQNEHREWKWNTCKNMHWILCAAYGFMPGIQYSSSSGGTFQIVSAPSEMDAAQYTTLNDKTEFKDRRPDGVTVHEVCTLNLLCKNNKELWELPPDREYTCNLKDKFKEFNPRELMPYDKEMMNCP